MSVLQELLTEFTAIASNPRAQLETYLQQGKKAIGCMPYFCPEELVHAAGMVPFGLWGAETQISEARRYLPAFICSIIQTTLELAIRGSYKGLSAVMTPILCDSLKSMDGNWRHAVKDIPIIPVAQAQNRKTEAGVEFTASQYRIVKAKLEDISGQSISDEDVAASIRLYNKRNAAVRRFIDAAAAAPGIIKPSGRSAVFKSSFFMDAADYTLKVETLCDCMQASSQGSGSHGAAPRDNAPAQASAASAQNPDSSGSAMPGPAVVTCGIIADNTGLLNILDDCGVVVVDDVVSHESLRFRFDTPETGDPITALAQTIGDIEGCPVLFDPGKRRFDMLVETVRRRNAAGVIIVMTKFCDPEEYDIVPLRKALQKNGIQHLTVEVDQQTTDMEQIRTAVETFCEILGS